MKEEHKLELFENNVLRKVYGLRKGQISEQFMIMHNEELRNIYWSPSTVRIVNSRKLMWLEGREEKRNAYRILVLKPSVKHSCGRRRSRWGISSRKLSGRYAVTIGC